MSHGGIEEITRRFLAEKKQQITGKHLKFSDPGGFF